MAASGHRWKLLVEPFTVALRGRPRPDSFSTGPAGRPRGGPAFDAACARSSYYCRIGT